MIIIPMKFFLLEKNLFYKTYFQIKIKNYKFLCQLLNALFARSILKGQKKYLLKKKDIYYAPLAWINIIKNLID